MISAEEWAETVVEPEWPHFRRVRGGYGPEVSGGCWTWCNGRGPISGARLRYRWISTRFNWSHYRRVVKAKAAERPSE